MSQPRRQPFLPWQRTPHSQLLWVVLACISVVGCSGQAPTAPTHTPSEATSQVNPEADAATTSESTVPLPATDVEPPAPPAENSPSSTTQVAEPRGGSGPVVDYPSTSDESTSSNAPSDAALPEVKLPSDRSTAGHEPPGYVPSLETEGESDVRHLFEAAQAQSIEVFFATDRQPTANLLPSPLRTLAPAAVVGMLGCALFVGFSLARRYQAVWLVSCGLAVCLGVTVLHASIIRLQQYARLAHNASTRFSAYRDESPGDYPLHLGSARVSLPATHVPGRFEQPKLYRFEFTESPKKHIVLHRLDVAQSAEAWFQEVSQAAKQTTGQPPEGFIFIHGYNVHFIDALKRTAQLASDLQLTGPAICYSWPSRGEVAAYTVDEATVSWSAPHFEQLLLDLHTQTRCRRIHVLAHSMGNRALLEALERIDLRRSAAPEKTAALPLIHTLVMAAPDVDRQQFLHRYATPLSNLTGHPTLYFSDADRALQLSAGVHGGPRLGLFNEAFESLPGIDSIYVGSQASLALGHSYYGDDPAVIDDLRQLLQAGTPAAQRARLRLMNSPAGHAYWQIDTRLQAQRPAIVKPR